ncbi:efflux RND transporter periplasmic adaptor subunit, partial [Staphylococcus epidermidis]|nr:efflux RND transporter periplasmic adaptor subunit [Staphylococcus epidermidis]
MKKKILWITVGVILLIIIAIIISNIKNDSENKGSKGYETYNVKKETPISLEGKASPESVKTYNNNQSVGN